MSARTASPEVTAMQFTLAKINLLVKSNLPPAERIERVEASITDLHEWQNARAVASPARRSTNGAKQ